MSLQIRMSGQILDLTPDSRADLTLTSPYLTYDDILSSQATIPNLPATPRNRRALGFPDLLQTETGHYRYHCEKYWNGQLIEQGVAVLTEAGTDYSFTIVQPLGEIFGDLQAKKLTEIDLGTIAAPTGGYVPTLGANGVAFPPVVNPDYYGQEGAGMGYGGLMNNPNGTGPVVPMPFLVATLRRIGELTGVVFDGAFMQDSAMQSLLLFNTREVMPAAPGSGETVIHLNRHVPDLKLSEFILELRALLNLAVTIRPYEGRITLDFTDDYVNRPAVKDWSSKAVKEYRKRPETLPRLLLGSEWDGGDALLKDKPAQTLDYLSPGGVDSDDTSGAAVLRSKFSTCLTDAQTGYPTIKQTGVSERFNQLTAKFAPRLLFFNGLANGVALASNTHTATDQTLFWTGAGGLQARRWAGVEAMRARQFYVIREMNLTETDVATLDFREKVHINGVDYLVVNVLVSLPVMAPALCTLLRC